jgi:transposase
VLGIDETRARIVRWILEDVGWRRSDPWMTSFVDADTTGVGLLLGLTPGRSGGCVRAWLGEQTPEFRARIELVVIDPSAPYAAGIRAALPNARIAVDHWHLVRLANDMLTQVGQRVTRELHERRGLATDPVWAHRRMLLTAGNCLSRKQLDRVLTADDPDGRGRRRLGLQGTPATTAGRVRPGPDPARCGASTAPAPTRTCPRPAGWLPPPRPGGRPSSSQSPSA